MSESITLTVSAGQLPAAELEQLLVSVKGDDDVQVEMVGGGSRSLDPAVTVGILQLAAAVAAPFLGKLAERLFKRAPGATVRGQAADGAEIVVTAADDAAGRAAKITVIVDQPAPKLTITVY